MLLAAQPGQQFLADDVQRLLRLIVQTQRILGHAGCGEGLDALHMPVQITQIAGQAQAFDQLGEAYTGGGRFSRDTRKLLTH